MVRNRQALLVLLFCGTSFSSVAQDNYYFVAFKDKLNNGFSVMEPEAFLSSKGIDRRSKHNIAIVEQDLPITSAYKTTVSNLGIAVFESSKWFNGIIIKSTQTEAEQLKNEVFVDAITYLAPSNYAGRVAQIKDTFMDDGYPSDTLFQNQILNVNDMHLQGYLGEGMTIAVFDAGFSGVHITAAFSHIFDNNQMKYCYDFISKSANVYQYSSHGTKTLSLMAATIDNSYQGITPNADYMLFVTENILSEYRIEEYYWLIAAEKADSAGVNVISSALGYSTFDDPVMNYSHRDMNGRTTLVTKAANIASEKGMIVVNSAGNEGASIWNMITAPADMENGLAVGSIQSNYELSPFSSTGPSADGRIKPDVVALGTQTSIINEFGVITTGNGTSYSAPQVAGLAAGLWQAYPDFTNLEMMEAIRNSADNVSSPNNKVGYGIPSFFGIVNYLENTVVSQPIEVYPNPILNNQLLTVKVLDPSKIASVYLALYETSGRKIDFHSYSISWRNNQAQLGLSNLPQGLYFLKVSFDSSSEEYRIVKL